MSIWRAHVAKAKKGLCRRVDFRGLHPYFYVPGGVGRVIIHIRLKQIAYNGTPISDYQRGNCDFEESQAKLWATNEQRSTQYFP